MHSHWQSEDIEVNGLRLHYTRTGAGEQPALVLVHGFSDDGLCWTPVAEALQAEYDVVMVDARGHGRSDAPEQGYGSVEHAGDLAGVIGGLGLEQPAILGHSMGAATALALAGLYPQLPRAILLEDPPAFWLPPPPEAPDRHAWARDWILKLKRKTRDELIAELRADSPTWPEAELGPWADSKHRLSLNLIHPDQPAPLDWPATLRQIRCPVLLITADPDSGAIVTPQAAAAFQELTPQARLVHLPGAGHNIRREQYAPYMEVVRAFLKETL
jgi:N-formylmaleamate deformylase